MDPRQFDALVRRLGTRRSRRDTVRLSAAAALGMVARPSVQPAIAQETTPVAAGRYISIAFYPYDGGFGDAKTELKPLIRLMQQQPGFITLSFIEGDQAIYLVTTFLDKTTSDAGHQVLDEWIASSAGTALASTPERDQGEVFLRSDLGAGCPCNTSDDDPCGTGELVCCPLTDGERGFCMTAATICPVMGDENEDAPSATSTAIPTATSSCTWEGCKCIGGSPNSCDPGLSCCGAGEPGETGICMTTCPCGGEGCACIAAEVNTCDDGLICCAPGEIGGAGTCQYSCACTSEGCSCTTGVDGACDPGLVCCGIFSQEPGSIGACLSACAPPSPCPGAENCECSVFWPCNDGLICCGLSDSEITGICQTAC